MNDPEPTIPPFLATDLDPSYFLHEQWFEAGRVSKVHRSGRLESRVGGIRLMNGYGRVRDVFEDGTYYDVHTGKYEQPTPDDAVEIVP
jgi:hypothetical protein